MKTKLYLSCKSKLISSNLKMHCNFFLQKEKNLSQILMKHNGNNKIVMFWKRSLWDISLYRMEESVE